jgi:hypothetical protein
MKHQILLATLLGFAAAANAAISKTEHALVLDNVHLAGEGHLAGMLSIDPVHSFNGPGALVSIQVLEGSVKSVTEKVDALIAENPYNRPLKLLASVVPVEAGEAEESAPAGAADADKAEAESGAKPAKKAAKKKASAGKFEKRVIVIVGTYQP